MTLTVHSDCSPACTEKAVTVSTDTLAKGLKVLNEVTRRHEKEPHGFDMTLNWIRLTPRENKPDVIAFVSFGVTSSLLQIKNRDEVIKIPGYTEAFQFSLDPVDVDYEGIHDGILYILMRAYELAMVVKNERMM